MSWLVQLLGQRLQLDRRPLKRARDAPRAERAIPTVRRAGACRRSASRKLDHFAAPMNSTFWSFRLGKMRAALHAAWPWKRCLRRREVVERTSWRRKRSAGRACAARAERAGRLGGARRSFIWRGSAAARHHRVQARSDPERMTHRLFLVEGIKVRARLPGPSGDTREPARRPAVLARDTARSMHVERIAASWASRASSGEPSRGARRGTHALADRERSCLMVQPRA